MFKTVVYYSLSALVIFSGAANAASTCDTYNVIPGDTLRLISERYYGTRALSPIIYEANSAIIGENPNTIEIGMELSIPCRKNMRAPEPSAFLAVIPPAQQQPSENPSLFLSRAGETPFINQDGTGLAPEILAASLHAGGYQNSVHITRPASITDVLQVSTGPSALLSFPWVLPNCAAPESLSPQSLYLCQNYTFSDPLFEITLGIFTLETSPLAHSDTASQFQNTTICVPQFHTADMLGENGISATNAIVVVVPELATCIAGLTAGNFDAFVADYQSFSTFSPKGSGMVDIPAFAQQSTLHAIAYSKNPAALAALKMVNTGLKQIMASGEWFGIVNQNLTKKSY